MTIKLLLEPSITGEEKSTSDSLWTMNHIGSDNYSLKIKSLMESLIKVINMAMAGKQKELKNILLNMEMKLIKMETNC